MREKQKGNRVHKKMGGKWGTGDFSESDSKLLESVPDLFETAIRHSKMEVHPKRKQTKTKEIRRRDKSDSSLPVKGVVIAKKCKYCQHHEIGVKTKTGYLQLKPGLRIEVIEE